MSIDIASIAATPAPAAMSAAASPAPLAMVTAVVESTEPVTVDMIPAVPPQEVLDAIQTASQSYDAVAATGHQIHFATDPQSGRLSIQLLGPSGAPVAKLTPGKALAVAAVAKLDLNTKGS